MNLLSLQLVRRDPTRTWKVSLHVNPLQHFQDSDATAAADVILLNGRNGG